MGVVAIRNLRGVLLADGFEAKHGRRPTWADCQLLPGPAELVLNDDGTTRYVGPQLAHVDSAATAVIDGRDAVAGEAWADCHTHALHAGTRVREHFARWQGLQGYAAATAEGGGVHVTTRSTVHAADEDLVDGLVSRLRAMAARGVSVVEVKSGYGGRATEELRMLRLIRAASDRVSEIDVIPTFLGLHAVPAGRSEEAYTDEMAACLPDIARDGLAEYADCFPESGFLSLDAAREFARRAAQVGLKIKVHADQLSGGGTTEAFVELGATSVDHLEYISATGVDGLSAADTVAVLLPSASFFLHERYANARRLIDAGARVALATDFNPGSAPEPDLGFAIRLAASHFGMTAAEIYCAVTYNARAAVQRPRAGWRLWKVRGGFSGPIGEEWLQQLLLEGTCDWPTGPEHSTGGES